MKNKIFATIGGAVAALCPWVTHAETFPTDGNMLENKTYESAATYNNLGTYAGPVSAAAEYADILYQVGAGQYLPAGSEGVGAVCTAGNYCPGLTDATYNATDNQGLTACPNGYPMSESGASVNTQCYTPCTDASVIAHATAVSGEDYFGNGTDTCYPTACDNGYHVDGVLEVNETDPLVPGANTDVTASSVGYIDPDGSKYNESEFGLTENGTWGAKFSYGTVYGQASCQSEGGAELDALNYFQGVWFQAVASADEVRTELSKMVDADKANAVANAYAEFKAGSKTKNEVYKIAYTVLGTEYDANFSKTDSGKYCYCQMTAYSASGSSELIPVTSAPWVFAVPFLMADYCSDECPKYCTEILQDATPLSAQGLEIDSEHRAVLLGAISARTVNVCAANEISITWADADPADVAANNAGVCTYDGDIRTPAKAITKPGKTFKGWKFQKSN